MSESGAIFKAMSSVMAAVGHVAKTRQNKQQGYSFRGIDDLYAALQGPMVAAGVFCVPTVLDHSTVERQTKLGGTLIYTTLKVVHRFYASDGSFVDAVTIGEAMDSGDKSSNKAMSAALKYAFLEVFCIPTEGDNDSETQTHEVTPEARPLAPNPARSLKDRYNDVCEEIERRMGMVAGDKFIDAVKAKHGGSAGTPAQKQKAIEELETLVAGGGVDVSDHDNMGSISAWNVVDQ